MTTASPRAELTEVLGAVAEPGPLPSGAPPGHQHRDAAPLAPAAWVVFRSRLPGSYDVQWTAAPGTVVAAGEVIARSYRCVDGAPVATVAPVGLTVSASTPSRNRKVQDGEPIVHGTLLDLELDPAPSVVHVHREVRALALAVNAAFKGLMGSLGESGQITDRTIPVAVELDTDQGWEPLVAAVVAAVAEAGVRDGDVVVISEKVVAIGRGRIFPLALFGGRDPKDVDPVERREMAATIGELVPDVTANDLILADLLLDRPEGAMATAGPGDANTRAHDLAEAIRAGIGVRCDVVVSDTDTGLDVDRALIGTVTIGATPLGTTAGLSLYECMRVANAAEFARGSHRRVPIVICRPHPRRAVRPGTGDHLGYSGLIHADRHATLT